ncbi:MAG: hypothetical protein M3P43_12780 [Actinomycetota bacterium]|nr:hypothetical protein [Actinomycetota bacterium]
MRRKDIVADLDHVVGANAKNKAIECKMVNGAHRDPVGHDGLASLRVLFDMSSLEQLWYAQSTKGALAPVCLDDTTAEHRLMQPLSHDSLGVRTSKDEVWGREQRFGLPLLAHGLVESNNELLLLGFLLNEPDRNVNEIGAGFNAFKPGESLAKLHGSPEGNVIPMVAITSSPLVPRIAIRSDRIIVGSVFGSQSVRGQDREGGLMSFHLSNARLSDERNAHTLELEPLQLGPRGHATIAR